MASITAAASQYGKPQWRRTRLSVEDASAEPLKEAEYSQRFRTRASARRKEASVQMTYQIMKMRLHQRSFETIVLLEAEELSHERVAAQ